jgi:hypothetical protein
MKKSFLFGSIIVIVVTILIVSGLNVTRYNSEAKSYTNNTITNSESVSFSEEKIIGGSKNPELISDELAYGVFFRFLSDRHSSEEKAKMIGYFRQMRLEDIDVETMISIGNDYKNRTEQLKSQRPATQPLENSEVYSPEQKVLVNDLVNTLNSRIGNAKAVKIQKHIRTRVKERMKIVPGPEMPKDSTH